MPDPPDTTDEANAVLPFTVTNEPPGELGPGESAADVLQLDKDASDSLGEGYERRDATDSSDSLDVAGKRIALVGRFGSMSHREAGNVIQSYHGAVVELPRQSRASDTPVSADWVVIGAEQPPLSQTELLGPQVIESAARGELEIIHETELWQRLGLVDIDPSSRRLYTPAMLADLLDVSVRVVRRWHRLGLITPVATLHKLPYFDYAEVATAKRLAGWIVGGARPAAIEKRLAELIEILPNIQRPLDQLSILVEGKHVLLRQGDGLVEPGGQMRFDFDALDGDHTDEVTSEDQSVLAFHRPDDPPMLRAVSPIESDELLAAAYEAEDNDDLETAIELYHAMMARDGIRSDICFQIAELLYRLNQLVAARERYYAAIELDPDFVEARASLGAVLAELGEDELAIAAMQGALKMHGGYADVHYALAKTLDKVGRASEAIEHWQAFLEMAPESAWAEEARERLGDT